LWLTAVPTGIRLAGGRAGGRRGEVQLDHAPTRLVCRGWLQLHRCHPDPSAFLRTQGIARADVAGWVRAVAEPSEQPPEQRLAELHERPALDLAPDAVHEHDAEVVLLRRRRRFADLMLR